MDTKAAADAVDIAKRHLGSLDNQRHSGRLFSCLLGYFAFDRRVCLSFCLFDA